MPNANQSSVTSAQGYKADDRNQSILVYVNGEFASRDSACVSIFDSGFVCGDGVWEGLRLVNGRLIELDEHLERLYSGAKFISLDIGLSKQELEQVIWQTLHRNKMNDGVHIRLMITRGRKTTPNQDPRFVIGAPTIVIVPEYKVRDPLSLTRGISLHTSTFRCSTPDVFDLQINSHSRLNLIQALVQAISAGADEALMLDPNGFVASCNSTNFFVIRRGELWTSSGRYSFKGITQKTIMRIAKEAGITVFAGDFTLSQAYSADEAFVTGTLGGITPVSTIDGRTIGDGESGALTKTLLRLYEKFLQGT